MCRLARAEFARLFYIFCWPLLPVGGSRDFQRRAPCVSSQVVLYFSYTKPAGNLIPGNYELLFRLDEAERQALHYLAGAIQRAVPEALAPVSPELIAEGKRRWLLSRPK